MEHFAKTFNGLYLSVFLANGSILDATGVLDIPLEFEVTTFLQFVNLSSLCL